MKYNDFAKAVNDKLRDIEDWYGDFGITYKVVWNGNYVADIEVCWSPVTACSCDSVHRFAEALNAAAFEAAKLTGLYIED